MSFQAMTIALAIDVPATQKSLLLCLANYVNEQNKFWPSYSTLSKDSGMCRRTVISHMNKFVDMGVVSKQLVMSEKGNQSNLYTFKGVQYLKKLGYIIELTDTGYIKISPPQPNDIEGCNSITPLVQDDHYPSDPRSPNTISEPIKEKDIYANFNFSQWPERPPNEFLAEHISHRKQKRAVRLSQPILDRLGKEVIKAIAMGYSYKEVLEIWLFKAWISFEAEWLTKENKFDKTNTTEEQRAINDKAARAMADSRKRFNM